MQKDNTITYILIGLGILLAGGLFYYWWNNRETMSLNTAGASLPNATGGGNTGASNTGAGNTNAGNTGANNSGAGTTTNNVQGSQPVTPLYNQNKGKVVVGLGWASNEARLAQYILKEGLKAYGLTDNVGTIDGKIGNNTKKGLKALIDAIPAPMRVATDSTITLEQLALIVNNKVGSGQDLDTGISKITYQLINAK